jgi:ribonuclease BN (tRNA processing enzyme)
MRLTVLGSSPACQNPGGGCSGYLVQQRDTTILLDCGSGVFGRLQQYVQPEDVDALVISHLHADHLLDLIQYRYYLYFSAHAGRSPRRPALYLPPGGSEKVLELSRLQDPSATFFSDTFEVHEYAEDSSLQLGAFAVQFVPVRHIAHTYGARVAGDAVLSYSADSGPCDGLQRLAQSSDLFLCECANIETSEYPLHLTPRQAGAVASQAGAKQLVLTHRWHVYGLGTAVTEAREAFEGPITMAHEDMQLEIG